ncbi:DNA repair protein RecO [uncultured Senegalimassilia sp.]|uniref:DNA repair protein RecO n=1 Tax=uncultured Senegalimassilia sp. TaxID=1714350 RepID=UPI0025F7038D|nr:DNA repair protein RecO [uncultured Senegalimassilia sp.]
MAQSTYSARVLVLRKTKLGESDLILSLLAQDGSQIRAVAKGARKPTSQFSSRLELYSQADVLLAQGRSLDIVKEARLIAGNAALRESMELAACAAPIAELLDRITQPGLEVPKLFDLTETALGALASSDPAHGPAMCAAWLLKAFAFLGIRPSLDRCCVCGQPLACDVGGAVHQTVAFSCGEGGVVCDDCRVSDVAGLAPEALSWSRALLGMRFADIASIEIDQSCVFDVLRLCQTWAQVHASIRLKSLNFLFTCGLF